MVFFEPQAPLAQQTDESKDQGDAPAALPHVLVLDDQLAIRNLLHEVLSSNHYRVSLTKSLAEAKALIETQAFDAVIVDIFLSDTESGLHLLPFVHEHQPNTPAIVISGMARMDHVIEALKAGAYDMLCKPFNIIDVLHVVARGVEKKQMADENTRLVEALRQERNLLEQRVDEATQDLKEKVETLRLLNEQIAAMLELSQTTGSAGGVLRRVFEMLRRMIDFEGAFCVLYDIRARGINLSYSEGTGVDQICASMTELFRVNGQSLAELAETAGHLPVNHLQGAIRAKFPDTWPGERLMIVPLHVYQTLMGVVGLIRRPGAPMHISASEERILSLVLSHFLAAFEQRQYVARTGQLAGLGELISEIAHDLRHPMTAMRGASQILHDHWAQPKKRNRCIGEIQTNLSRMESLVSELVTFYNPKELNMLPVDLSDLLDKAIEVCRSPLEQKRIQVVRSYQEKPITILGLTRNLIEAIVNLISNACQAMDEGGRLEISSNRRLGDKHQDRLRGVGRQPAQFVVVTIRDNGCGIPEDHMDRVFLRFFTTRPEGHGLGLSAVQRIIKKNLGHIHLESKEGQGATFYIYLPKA